MPYGTFKGKEYEGTKGLLLGYGIFFLLSGSTKALPLKPLCNYLVRNYLLPKLLRSYYSRRSVHYKLSGSLVTCTVGYRS